MYQWRLTRINDSWDQHSAQVAREGSLILQEAVRREVDILDSIAHRALSAPVDTARAFDYLAALGSVLNASRRRSDRPHGTVAWAGTLRSPEAQPGDTSDIQWTPFYIVIRRIARGEGRIATADAVLHAEPPADRVAGSVDAWLRRSPELAGFAYREVDRTAPGEQWQLMPVGSQFVAIQPRLLSQGEAILRESETARRWTGLGLSARRGYPRWRSRGGDLHRSCDGSQSSSHSLASWPSCRSVRIRTNRQSSIPRSTTRRSSGRSRARSPRFPPPAPSCCLAFLRSGAPACGSAGDGCRPSPSSSSRR